MLRAEQGAWWTLHSHLRCQRKRKRRYGKPDKRGQIKGRISIDTRPSIVAERTRLGDWEADTVEGSKGGPVLVTLAERKSRLFLVGKAPSKSASEVQRVIERLLTPIKDFVHTVTYDNGKEFSYHAAVSSTLNAQGFFAHPYHSWERGLNENCNGLLRQYFPKGMSLASVTQDEIIAAMCRLNWRPRKSAVWLPCRKLTLALKPARQWPPSAPVPSLGCPACEVRGEGIFIRLREENVRTCEQKPEVQALDALFCQAHQAWWQNGHFERLANGYPSVRFVLLHSFVHALMRHLTLECGYTAASVRERIYCRIPTHEGGPMKCCCTRLPPTARAHFEGDAGENLTRSGWDS